MVDDDFLAVVDVDAGGGGDVLAHGLAHQVVVVVVLRTALRLVGHHLVNAIEGAMAVAHAFVYDFAVLHHMAQTAPLLIVGIRVWLARERRQQVTHVITVKADALDHIGQRVTLFANISVSATRFPFYRQRL